MIKAKIYQYNNKDCSSRVYITEFNGSSKELKNLLASFQDRMQGDKAIHTKTDIGDYLVKSDNSNIYHVAHIIRKSPNYINTLQEENKSLTIQVGSLLTGIIELEKYLTSSKFHKDTTVQASDVLYRLQEIRSNYINIL